MLSYQYCDGGQETGAGDEDGPGARADVDVVMLTYHKAELASRSKIWQLFAQFFILLPHPVILRIVSILERTSLVIY